MGVHFDALAELFQFSETLRTWRCGNISWREVAQRAALFEIPIDPNPDTFAALNDGRRGYDDETMDVLTENFFLPFPDVIVEDDSGCVILSDVEEKQRGLSGFRQILTYRANPFDGGAILSSAFASVSLDRQFKGGRWLWNVNLDHATGLFVSPFRGEVPVDFSLLQGVFSEDAGSSFDEVIYLNTPNRYILQERPLNPTPEERQAQWRRRVLRTNERARYVLLKPGEIKARYFPEVNGEEHEHAHKAPHYRRAHYRSLSSEFYVNKRGQTVLIPASWIGPEVARRGNREYRVLLDR